MSSSLTIAHQKIDILIRADSSGHVHFYIIGSYSQLQLTQKDRMFIIGADSHYSKASAFGYRELVWSIHLCCHYLSKYRIPLQPPATQITFQEFESVLKCQNEKLLGQRRQERLKDMGKKRQERLEDIKKLNLLLGLPT